MKKYDIFIINEKFRADTKQVKRKDVRKMIKEYCSDFDPKNIPIYRGVQLNLDHFTLDPKKYNRESLTKNNTYNVIIDNTWDDKYPKRKNSIICTTRLR